MAFIREHHERICHLHNKNTNTEVCKRDEDEKFPFAKAVGMGMLCERTTGTIDYQIDCHTVLAALQEVDYNGFVIVKRDIFPVVVDRPLPITERPRAYLRAVSFGRGVSE